MRPRLAQFGDIAFCGILIVAAIFVLDELQGLKKSPFDYLASSAVPKVLAWLIIFLSGLVIIRSVYFMTIGNIELDSVEKSPRTSTGNRRQLIQVGVVILSSIAYIVSITSSPIPYSVSTAILLCLNMAVLSPVGNRRWGVILVLSVAIGALGEFIFTNLLSLSFPGFDL